MHSAFTFAYESLLSRSPARNADVPPGALIAFMQKGLQYIGIEEQLNDDGSIKRSPYAPLTMAGIKRRKLVSNSENELKAGDGNDSSEMDVDDESSQIATNHKKKPDFSLLAPHVVRTLGKRDAPIKVNIPSSAIQAAAAKQASKSSVAPKDTTAIEPSEKQLGQSDTNSMPDKVSSALETTKSPSPPIHQQQNYSGSDTMQPLPYPWQQSSDRAFPNLVANMTAPAGAATQHAQHQSLMQQQVVLEGKVATTPASTGAAKQPEAPAGMTPTVQKPGRGSPTENTTTEKSAMKKKNKNKEKNSALQSPSIVSGKKKSPQSSSNVAAPVFPMAGSSQPAASSLGGLPQHSISNPTNITLKEAMAVSSMSALASGKLGGPPNDASNSAINNFLATVALPRGPPQPGTSIPTASNEEQQRIIEEAVTLASMQRSQLPAHPMSSQVGLSLQHQQDLVNQQAIAAQQAAAAVISLFNGGRSASPASNLPRTSPVFPALQQPTKQTGESVNFSPTSDVQGTTPHFIAASQSTALYKLEPSNALNGELVTGEAKVNNLEADDELTKVPDSEILNLDKHTSEVFMCAWNPIYTRIIATGSGDASARIWEMGGQSAKDGYSKSTVLQHGHPGDRNKDVTTLEWSPDGELLATGSYDGVARVWRRSGELMFILKRHRGPIFSLKWNKRGNFLLSGSYDKTTVVWDIASSAARAAQVISSGGPGSRHPFPDPCIVRQQFEFHLAPALDVDWKDDLTFASCSTDKCVHIVQVGSDTPLQTFTGHTDEVNAVKWDPSGTMLASCSDDCTAKVWAWDSSAPVGTTKSDPLWDFKSHEAEIYTVKW